MRIIRNKYIPFKGYAAINLFGIVFARAEAKITDRTLRHEAIHTVQMKERWYVFFYLQYLVEWLWLLAKYRDPHKAYREISFEKEAYEHENELDYLERRK